MSSPRACSSGKSKHTLRAFAFLAALVLSACNAEAPFNYLRPEGPRAIESDRLWDFTFGVAVVVFFVVEGALLLILIKYREGSRPSGAGEPLQTHGHTKLELLWTTIPVILLTVVAFITVPVIFAQSREPQDALKVEITGHQWWWEYEYENGVVTANELHIPVNRPVVLELKSEDVIHSYWIPKLAGKQDVVPGRVNHLTIEATEPGQYLGQCAEYCGLSHANMRAVAIAHEPADFDRWVEEQLRDSAQDPLAAEGREIFLNGKFAGNQQCVACHAVKGTPAQGAVGPNLTHFASRERFAGSMFERTDENLEAWLRDPPARKAGSKMPDLNLNEQQIRALVAYLQSLK